MMAIATKSWDPAEFLTGAADIVAYLNTYFEDGTPDELWSALDAIARSPGLAELASASGISEGALHRAFTDRDSATLRTMLELLRAFRALLTLPSRTVDRA